MSAVEAIDLFISRELSPVELMQAVIARAEETEPAVNSLCHTFFREALRQARKAEARYAGRGGGPPRLLEGIPLAVKEDEAVAAQPWTQGSLVCRDLVARRSSTFIRRAVRAGAIIHARSSASEFSCGGFTHSRLWGITRNPWNPQYAVGGSSGGSSAALASGATTLASGSDIGGSVGVPAALGGVVAFRPPYGRVPQDPPFNLDPHRHGGPMARTVADCALLENAVSGPDPLDMASLRDRVELPRHLLGIQGIEEMRIAVSVDLGDWPLEPDVRENALAVAEALRGEGARVDQVELSIPRADVVRARTAHLQQTLGPWLARMLRQHSDLVTPYVAHLSQSLGGPAVGATLADRLRLEARLYLPVGTLFEDYDALICPAVGTTEIAAGEDHLERPLEVAGQMLDSPLEAMPALVFNVLNRCPVLSAPSGRAWNGVPTGVQIAAPTFEDLTVFRVGAALERARPWLRGPERVPAVAQAVTELESPSRAA